MNVQKYLDIFLVAFVVITTFATQFDSLLFQIFSEIKRYCF